MPRSSAYDELCYFLPLPNGHVGCVVNGVIECTFTPDDHDGTINHGEERDTVVDCYDFINRGQG